MKKISLPLLAAAAAAVAFAGCSVEEMIGPAVAEAPSRTLKVNFSASNAATRTSFSGFNEEAGVYPVIWSGQEAVVMSLNYDDPADATLTKVTDSHATFSGAFNDTGAPYVFYALSPSSAATAISPSRNAWAVNIPVEQTPLEGSCDEAAQIIASVSDRYQSVPDPVQLHFSHVTTYVRVTLKNLDAAVSAAGVESPAVTSFDLTFEVPVAGEWYYDFENKAISEKDASYTVRALTSDLTDVWLALAPCDLDGKSLKVSVNTDKGSFVRTVAFPSGRKYAAGKVNTLSVNMAAAEFVQSADRWVLVTDASTLSDGDEVIITNSASVGSAYAISTTQNTNNRGCAAVSIIQQGSETLLQDPGEKVERFILTAGSGTYSSCFRFRDATNSTEGYLACTNSVSNNYLKTSNSNNGYDNWVITISNQSAVISSYGTVTSGWSSYYRQIRFNSSNVLFGTYRSSSQTTWNSSSTGMNEVYIFRKNPAVDPDADPILGNDIYGAYLSSGNTLHTAGTTQLSREYLDDSITFAILFPGENKVLEFSGIPQAAAKGDAFDLALVNVVGRKKTTVGTFAVTVVKEDGPKLWLSDFLGNGFIVKR